MANMERKSFDTPDETRLIQNGKLDVVKIGDITAMRVCFDPGWSWSECVKPVVGTASCQVPHLMHIVSGHMAVRMDDGTQTEFAPGDVGVIPPGHDAWVVGKDPLIGIDFQGGAVYAKPGAPG